jgi:adenine-specific DNA-methyltransferase
MAWPPQCDQDLAGTCAALARGEPGPAGVREAILAGQDPLGRAFCALRPARTRRGMGAFYTPGSMVEAMVRWVLAERPARIVDCGCGSGRFTVALRRAGFEGPIVAVDLDPLAVAMTKANLVVAGLAPAHLRGADFLGMHLEAIEGSTAFIGNPPYLRHHDLDPSVKAKARHIAGALGLKLSGLAGLHVLFLLAVASGSTPGDLGCFVTSAEWLDVGYGAVARGLLSGPLGLRFLAVLDPRAVAFEDAMTTAAVFGWRCGSRTEARLRRLSDLPELPDHSAGVGVPLASLRTADRWTPLLEARSVPHRSGLVPLGSFARVHRGVATGANSFFVIERGEGRALGLEPWLHPCLHRARQVQRAGGLVRADVCSHGLLMLPEALPNDPAVAAHVARGQAAEVPERYLCRQRRAWWHLPLRRGPAPIVATYMARTPPSFALNPDGCTTTNVVHGIFPMAPMNEAELRALVCWLNEHAHELTGHRSYHGGLKKWEPRELEGVLVPRPQDLPDKT